MPRSNPKKRKISSTRAIKTSLALTTSHLKHSEETPLAATEPAKNDHVGFDKNEEKANPAIAISNYTSPAPEEHKDTELRKDDCDNSQSAPPPKAEQNPVLPAATLVSSTEYLHKSPEIDITGELITYNSAEQMALAREKDYDILDEMLYEFEYQYWRKKQRTVPAPTSIEFKPGDILPPLPAPSIPMVPERVKGLLPHNVPKHILLPLHTEIPADSELEMEDIQQNTPLQIGRIPLVYPYWMEEQFESLGLSKDQYEKISALFADRGYKRFDINKMFFQENSTQICFFVFHHHAQLHTYFKRGYIANIASSHQGTAKLTYFLNHLNKFKEWHFKPRDLCDIASTPNGLKSLSALIALYPSIKDYKIEMEQVVTIAKESHAEVLLNELIYQKRNAYLSSRLFANRTLLERPNETRQQNMKTCGSRSR